MKSFLDDDMSYCRFRNFKEAVEIPLTPLASNPSFVLLPAVPEHWCLLYQYLRTDEFLQWEFGVYNEPRWMQDMLHHNL